MNIKCNVIRDLLPLYIDDVVSDESRQLIEEHLADCQECRAYLEELKSDAPSPQDPDPSHAQESRILHSIKRRILVRNMLLVLFIAALVGAAVWVVHGFFNTDEPAPLSQSLEYTLPEGFTQVEMDDPEYLRFRRDTDEYIESIKIYENYSTKHTPSDGDIIIDENTVIADPWWEEANEYRPHGYSDDFYIEIYHNDISYSLYYKCKVKGKDNYYDSYRPEAQTEIIDFARSFRFDDSLKAEKPSFGDIIKDPYAIASIVILGLTLLIFLGMPIAMAIGGLIGSKEENYVSTKPVSSKDLHDDMNRERSSKGNSSLPPINTAQGVSTNTLARKDKSWSSVPDFFIKLFRGK